MATNKVLELSPIPASKNPIAASYKGVAFHWPLFRDQVWSGEDWGTPENTIILLYTALCERPEDFEIDKVQAERVSTQMGMGWGRSNCSNVGLGILTVVSVNADVLESAGTCRIWHAWRYSSTVDSRWISEGLIIWLESMRAMRRCSKRVSTVSAMPIHSHWIGRLN